MAEYELVTKPVAELTDDEHSSINQLIRDRLENEGVGNRADTRDAYVREAEAARRNVAAAIGGRILRGKQIITNQTSVLMYDHSGQLRGYAALDTNVSSRRPGSFGDHDRERKLTEPALVRKRYLRTNMFLWRGVDDAGAPNDALLRRGILERQVTAYDAMFLAGTDSSFEDGQPVTTYPFDGEAVWGLVAESWGCRQTGDSYPVHVTDDESFTARRLQGPACGVLRAAILAKPNAAADLAQIYGN